MPIPLGILAVAGAGAGGGGAFDLLETTVLGTAAASITFSNLNNYSDYKHLQIRMVARSARAAADSSLVAYRLNGDSGTNYTYHRLQGDGSGVFSDAGTSQSQMQFQVRIPGSTSTASAFGAATADFLDFNNTSKNTTVRSFGGQETGNNKAIALNSSVWMNTNAVTSIEVFDVFSSNFVVGSRFSLYGIK